MTRFLAAAFLALAGSIAGPPAIAQAPRTVPLSGSIRDIYTSGGVLAGATVVVTSHRTGDRITVATGPDGLFFVPALEPGIYTIAVSMRGYGGLVMNNFCVETAKPARFSARLDLDRGDQTRPAAAAASQEPPNVFAPQVVPSIPAMSSAEIQEAMAFGRASGRLKAHRLSARRGALFGGRSRAALLTPFLRVATMTQVATASKRAFAESEIPAWMTQKLVWIVGSPAEHYLQSSDMDSPQYLASVSAIAIRPAGSTNAAADIQPSWKMYLGSTCDVDMYEALLGRQFSERATIAAFPMDVLKAGNTILFTHGSTGVTPNNRQAISLNPEVRTVKIGDADVRKWR